MVRSTWAALTAGLSSDDLALFEAYRAIPSALPGVEERVHATEVAFAVHRVFTSGYMKSHWLEISIDLLREADVPGLKMAFTTTKKVWTHRFTIGSADQLPPLKPLIVEACETVGPGTR